MPSKDPYKNAVMWFARLFFVSIILFQRSPAVSASECSKPDFKVMSVGINLENVHDYRYGISILERNIGMNAYRQYYVCPTFKVSKDYIADKKSVLLLIDLINDLDLYCSNIVTSTKDTPESSLYDIINSDTDKRISVIAFNNMNNEKVASNEILINDNCNTNEESTQSSDVGSIEIRLWEDTFEGVQIVQGEDLGETQEQAH